MARLKNIFVKAVAASMVAASLIATPVLDFISLNKASVNADAIITIKNTFKVKDIRDGKTTTIGAGIGKAQVIVFGNYRTCMNTQNTLHSLSEILDNDIDSSELTVVYIALNGTKTDYDAGYDVKSGTSKISNKIYYADLRNSSGVAEFPNYYKGPYADLFDQCYKFSESSGGFTMPLVTYINKSGDIVMATTGAKSITQIKSNLVKTGVGEEVFKTYQTSVDVKGTRNYDYAYEILDQLNAYRKANGLKELKMDEELLESAMIRASECVINFSHTRPNGENCFTVATQGRMMGENIAFGYKTPTDVMAGWKASAGHNANMLSADWDYVGIGCFCYNGVWYWAQSFGYGTPKTTSKSSYPSTKESTSTIKISTDVVDISFKYNKYTAQAGAVITPVIEVGDIERGLPTDLTLVSSDTSVAEIINNGKEVRAVGGGSVTITLVYKNTVIDKFTIEVSGSASVPTTAPSTSTPTTTPTKPTTTPTGGNTGTTTGGGSGTTGGNGGNTGNTGNTGTTTGGGSGTTGGNSGSTGGSTTGGNGGTTGSGSGNNTTGTTPAPSTTESGISSFIERLYVVALGRSSDAKGKADWIDKVKTQGYTGAQLAEGFLYSPEFLNKSTSDSEFLDVLYATFFNRPADAAGKSGWLNLLVNGTSRLAVIRGFIDSVEFANLCLTYGIASGSKAVPNITVNPSNDVYEFVDRIYLNCLGRPADSKGRSDWASQLANLKISGSKAAYGFFWSAEFLNKNYSDSEFVTRLYRVFMGREPDAAGYHNWMIQLSNGTSRKAVFDGFAGSQEWAGICAKYGILK